MPQTFLALVAVFILSTYSLSQLRNSAAIAQHAVQREIELAAADVARSHLASITERGFDEADAGLTTLRLSTIGLTAPADLGPDPGEIGPGDFDDVDDFHLPAGSVVLDSIEWDGTMLHFEVNVGVRYVDPSDPDTPAASATLAKEIVVSVRELQVGQMFRRPVVARLRAVVSAAAQRPI